MHTYLLQKRAALKQIHHGGEGGVAILSRPPAKATEGFMQAFEEGEEASPPRGFAYATVMLTDESVLAVYSVHLKSNSGGIEETTPKREESARTESEGGRINLYSCPPSTRARHHTHTNTSPPIYTHTKPTHIMHCHCVMSCLFHLCM